MEISEVTVTLTNNDNNKLKAFCSVTLNNEFVIKDIKIIEKNRDLMVSMPSRKINDHCDKCGSKNHLLAKYCNNCGIRLPENRAKTDSQGRIKLHADIAHPINTLCRQNIQNKVLEAFKKEVGSRQCF